MNSVFTNEQVFTFSDPLPTWLFDVYFYYYKDGASGPVDEQVKNVIATSVTLPTIKTNTIVKKYFGTEKSYPSIRTYGNDVTMTFNLYANKALNDATDAITQVAALRPTGLSYSYNLQPQISNAFNEHTGFVQKFNKIKVFVKNKTNEPVYLIEYKNCVITNFEFSDELNYDSENRLKCKLTFHSDLWLDTTVQDQVIAEREAAKEAAQNNMEGYTPNQSPRPNAPGSR